MSRAVRIFAGVGLAMAYLMSHPGVGGADTGNDNPGGSGSIGAEVSTPGTGSTGSGSNGSNEGGSDDSGEPNAGPLYCGMPGADPDTCSNQPAIQDLPAIPPGIPASVAAAVARDQVDITIPGLHTSPDGVSQVTGMRTWFWLDSSQWRSTTVRAELPGVWAEVTARPVRSRWTPGDGGATVVCDGRGRPHPGTSGATTDCGHVYTTTGRYTLEVAVIYEVTWRSSTGETGVQDPLVLTGDLPITVEQRQVVVS